MLAVLFRYPGLCCTSIPGLCGLLWTGPRHIALHTLPSVPSNGLELTPAECRCLRMRNAFPPAPRVPGGHLNVVPGGPCRAGRRCPFGGVGLVWFAADSICAACGLPPRRRPASAAHARVVRHYPLAWDGLSGNLGNFGPWQTWADCRH